MVTVSKPLCGWTYTPLIWSEGPKSNAALKSNKRKGLILFWEIPLPGIILNTRKPSPTIPGWAGRWKIRSIDLFMLLSPIYRCLLILIET